MDLRTDADPELVIGRDPREEGLALDRIFFKRGVVDLGDPAPVTTLGTGVSDSDLTRYHRGGDG
jgi:hypothetical protein